MREGEVQTHCVGCQEKLAEFSLHASAVMVWSERQPHSLSVGLAGLSRVHKAVAVALQ